MKPRSLFDDAAWVAREFKRPARPVSIVTLPQPRPRPKRKKGEKTGENPPTFSPLDRPQFEVAEPPGVPVSVHGIIKGVARLSGFPVEAITGTSTRCDLAAARQIALWLARNFTKRSLPGLGGAFKRDHTTVLYGIRKIDRMVSERGLRPPEDTLEGWATLLLNEHRADRQRRAEAERERRNRNYRAWRARRRAARLASPRTTYRVWRKRYKSLEEFKAQRKRRFKDFCRMHKDNPNLKDRARGFLKAWRARRRELGL